MVAGRIGWFVRQCGHDAQVKRSCEEHTTHRRCFHVPRREHQKRRGGRRGTKTGEQSQFLLAHERASQCKQRRRGACSQRSTVRSERAANGATATRAARRPRSSCRCRAATHRVSAASRDWKGGETSRQPGSGCPAEATACRFHPLASARTRHLTFLRVRAPRGDAHTQHRHVVPLRRERTCACRATAAAVQERSSAATPCPAPSEEQTPRQTSGRPMRCVRFAIRARARAASLASSVVVGRPSSLARSVASSEHP